jgi:hypothetical protein
MRLAELLSREVGAADLAHLASLREIIRPPERVRDRYLRIGLMELERSMRSVFSRHRLSSSTRRT